MWVFPSRGSWSVRVYLHGATWWVQFRDSQTFRAECHCTVQAEPHPFLHRCGWARLSVPLPVHPVLPSISPQSLDAVADQRGLVGYLPGAVSASEGQDQQEQQDDEDQGADRHQGVGDHPQDRLLQHPAGAVGRHVCCWEGPRDLRQSHSTAHWREIQDR